MRCGSPSGHRHSQSGCDCHVEKMWEGWKLDLPARRCRRGQGLDFGKDNGFLILNKQTKNLKGSNTLQINLKIKLLPSQTKASVRAYVRACEYDSFGWTRTVHHLIRVWHAVLVLLAYLQSTADLKMFHLVSHSCVPKFVYLVLVCRNSFYKHKILYIILFYFFYSSSSNNLVVK